MAGAVGSGDYQFVVSFGAPVEIAAHNIARFKQDERLAYVVVHEIGFRQRHTLDSGGIVDAVGERMVLFFNLDQLFVDLLCLALHFKVEQAVALFQLVGVVFDDAKDGGHQQQDINNVGHNRAVPRRADGERQLGGIALFAQRIHCLHHKSVGAFGQMGEHNRVGPGNLPIVKVSLKRV